MSKKLSKYIASFDYFDKSLDVLSASSDSIFIASVATASGIASASLSLTFSLSTGFFHCLQKLLKTRRNKKKSIIKLLC